MATISTPDYMFTGFYYPEILEALLAYVRVNAPELTSESEYEPHIQQLRSFALVGHLNNTRVDIIANELLLDSAQLRSSVKRLFKLIGYRLKSATPATAELVIKLSSIPTADIAEYIPIYTEWATEPESGDEVYYENTSTLALTRGDQIVSAFIAEQAWAPGGVNGQVDTAFPTRFYSATATFTVADVGRVLAITGSAANNHGRYQITDIVDANTVEVAGASFLSETSLYWGVYAFGADVSAALNDAVTPTTLWTMVSLSSENALYVGHPNIQWGQMDLDVNLVSPDVLGVWEYYDPTYSSNNPNLVTDLGPNIRFQVDALISQLQSGSWISRAGAYVYVTYNLTGQTETVVSLWDGTNNYIDTRGLLGQSVVDTDPLNYTIKVEWVPMPTVVDGTAFLAADGDVTYDFPMTAYRKWQKVEINSVEVYWARYRQIETGSPATSPVILQMEIDQGEMYYPFDAVQGRTVEEEIMGSSNGQPDQEFTTLQGPVFDDSFTLEIDETGSGSWVAWAPKENFLSSSSTDRHYKFDLDDDDRLVVEFGDGTNGRIPPIGTQNVRITYRIGGDVDGNVGAGQISNNIDGISFISSVENPMSAIGWTIKEGGDEASLALVKDAGPASIRNQGKAVSPEDIAEVAVDEYTTDDGSSIVARAFAVEEAFGPKTVQLVVVGSGGQFLDQDQLDDLDTWYNGDRYSDPPVPGVLLLNHELTSQNYTPKPIDVTVQVIGKGITTGQIRNALTAYLDPLAIREDDGTYEHAFGGRVAVVMLDCAIRDISTNITNVHRSIPASDVLLGATELPTAGTIIVTISETE